jgi:hypothetical protein
MAMSISPANDGDNVTRDAVAASCRETLHTEKNHHTQKPSIIHISSFTYVPARSIATEAQRNPPQAAGLVRHFALA